MDIREALLALLDSKARSAHELRAALEASTGGVWALEIGQLEGTLDELARDGLVNVGPGDDTGQRTYSVTDAGRSELARWLGTALVDAAPPRDELLLKVLLALGTPSVDARQLIQAQRTGIVEALQANRRRIRARRQSGGELVARLVDDALVVRPEADLRWLDLCEQRLIAQAASEPTRRSPR